MKRVLSIMAAVVTMVFVGNIIAFADVPSTDGFEYTDVPFSAVVNHSARTVLSEKTLSEEGHEKVWVATQQSTNSVNAATRMASVDLTDYVNETGVTVVEFDIKFTKAPRFLTVFRSDTSTTTTDSLGQIGFSEKDQITTGAEGAFTYGDNDGAQKTGSFNTFGAGGTSFRDTVAYDDAAWTHIKLIFDQRSSDNKAYVYVNQTAWKSGAACRTLSYTGAVKSIRFDYTLAANVGDELYYVDNMKVGRAPGPREVVLDNGLMAYYWGFFDTNDVKLDAPASGAALKLELENTSETDITVDTALSGYMDNMMKSFDFERVTVPKGEKIEISRNADKSLTVNESSVERLQLRILDSTERYPLMDAIELVAQ